MYERLQGKELETENMAKACQDFLFLFFFFFSLCCSESNLLGLGIHQQAVIG